MRDVECGIVTVWGAIKIAQRLTPASRGKILEIKSQCWMKLGYRRTFSSRDIYRAVLEKGIDNLAGFDAYLQSTKGCGVEGESMEDR